MNITKKHAARLASMAALGVGALALTSGEAQAGTVTTTVDVNVELGFASTAQPGYALQTSPFSLVLPVGSGVGPIGFRLANSHFRTTWTAGFMSQNYHAVGAFAGKSVRWATVTNSETIGLHELRIFGTSQQPLGSRSHWLSNLSYWAGPVLGHLDVVHVIFGARTQQSINTRNGPFGPAYARFEYWNGDQWDYGWVNLTGLEPDPDLLITAYGYETSSTTPEPGTLAMTGLSALALGALGLRKWRAARKAKAA